MARRAGGGEWDVGDVDWVVEPRDFVVALIELKLWAFGVFGSR